MATTKDEFGEVVFDPSIAEKVTTLFQTLATLHTSADGMAAQVKALEGFFGRNRIPTASVCGKNRHGSGMTLLYDGPVSRFKVVYDWLTEREPRPWAEWDLETKIDSFALLGPLLDAVTARLVKPAKK